MIRFIRASFRNQSGAMFGMDARVALMIFTALSGTLGYYAYGKLKAVREVALIKELEALDFALRSYQSDMSTFIPFTVNKPEKKSDVRNDISILWSTNRVLSNYRPLWNGPYVDFDKKDHTLYGNFTLSYMTDDMTACTPYTNCFAFIGITEVHEEVWKQVNAHIDEARGSMTEGETDAHLLGKLRADKLKNPRTLYYKSISRK